MKRVREEGTSEKVLSLPIVLCEACLKSERNNYCKGRDCFTIYTSGTNQDRCFGGKLRIRTLLQNSMTTLGDASTVGGAKVAGSVGDSLTMADVGRCWSQSAQPDFESAIEMKHDKSSKWVM